MRTIVALRLFIQLANSRNASRIATIAAYISGFRTADFTSQ